MQSAVRGFVVAGRFEVRPPEFLLAAYLIYTTTLAAALPLSDAVRLRAISVNSLAMLVFAAMIVPAWRARPPVLVLRDLSLLAMAEVAYQQMGWFAGAMPQRGLEQGWITWDNLVLGTLGVQRGIESLGSVLPALLELSYLFVYSVGPACLVLLYIYRRRRFVDEFLLIYLLGLLLAYAQFPFWPSEPPRTLFPGNHEPVATAIRRLNLLILGGAGIHTSVFPSAHVSGITAAALAMWRIFSDNRWVRNIIAGYAVLVTVATFYGRYHYAADAAAGMVVGVVAAAIGWTVMRFRTQALRRRVKKVGRTAREVKMFARAMASATHPILAQIIPTRRCNLTCGYCNEYDRVSDPVPLQEMLNRVDHLASLGTAMITLSGGEPLLHPDLDKIIARIRSRGAIATLISNGYLMTPERIRELNRAGLDYLQISIDNVEPDEISMKSLKVLDRKLRWLREWAEFDVSVNSVLGNGMARPEDAHTVARRARELGFTSTVGIIHDHSGQLVHLDEERQGVYHRILKLGTGLFSFAHLDQFQLNIVRGLPNRWHCPAGGRFLYVCEDGLVHYCSQQRGAPARPLLKYTVADLTRYGTEEKGCAPFCTISCVHQVAMLDDFRRQPRQTLAGILERRKMQDASFRPPVLVRLLSWAFLESKNRGLFGKAAVLLLGASASSDSLRTRRAESGDEGQ